MLGVSAARSAPSSSSPSSTSSLSEATAPAAALPRWEADPHCSIPGRTPSLAHVDRTTTTTVAQQQPQQQQQQQQHNSSLGDPSPVLSTHCFHYYSPTCLTGMPEPSALSHGAALPKRACDACHRRKVKCVPDPNAADSGICKNCASSGLACKYESVPQKKGPKGSRAKVISELREHQRRTSISSTLPGSVSPPPSPRFSRAFNALPVELIEACVDFFFDNVYPTQPILERNSLRERVHLMHLDPEAYCVVLSLCAYMLIQPHMQIPESLTADGGEPEVGAAVTLGMALLQDVLEARKSMSYVETPSVDCVRTSFFLFGCYFCFEKHNTAYFHLREATTLALLLGMDQEQTYADCDPLEAILKRRLFWLLYITERAYALQAQRPLTLHDTIALPEVTQEIGRGDADKLVGFIHLIVLFKPFDDTFVGLWNQSIDGGTSVDWICNLQKQLAEALPVYLRSTEAQAVDLKTSQQWLRVMIWQLSISQRLLSSNASDDALTFKYPLQLARQLATEASQFSQKSMEVHGIGLVKKLFDVACTLVDVMSCVPTEHNGFEFGPRDHLNHFIQIMSKLRGGQTRYLPLLLTKINETMPALQSPILLRALPSSLDGQFQETEVRDEQALVQSRSRTVHHGGQQYMPTAAPKLEFSDLVGTPSYASTNANSPYGDGSDLEVSFHAQQSSYPG